MSRALTIVGRTAAAVVLAAGLTACGEGEKRSSSEEPEPNGVADLKPAAAVKVSAKASRKLSDVTYEGTGTADYEGVARNGRMTLVVTDKDTCEMTFTSRANGRTRVRRVGDLTYYGADVKAWTTVFGAPQQAAELFRGKWFSVPTTEKMADSCTIRDTSAQTVDANSCTKRKKGGEVDGTPTAVFRCEDADDGEAATLYIATVGEPLVLRLVHADDDGRFDLRLVDHDAGIVIKAPRRKDIIDSRQLNS